MKTANKYIHSLLFYLGYIYIMKRKTEVSYYNFLDYIQIWLCPEKCCVTTILNAIAIKAFCQFLNFIPVSHRSTELKGREWKEFFLCRSMINGKQRLSLIDREKIASILFLLNFFLNLFYLYLERASTNCMIEFLIKIYESKFYKTLPISLYILKIKHFTKNIYWIQTSLSSQII